MGVLQLLKVQSRESGCVGFARPEHAPVHGSSFSPTGLLRFPSTWGLWFREQAKMAVKDSTAISKGNRICLSTNVIFNNLTGMNYRSGCFLSEAVTKKKLHFQLPSLLIFKPCFRLCKLVSPRIFTRAKVSVTPPSFPTSHPPQRMQLVLTRCSRAGLWFWATAVPPAERLTYITEQTHVCGERQRLWPINRSSKTLLEQNWDIWPFPFFLNKCINFYSEPI